MDCNCNRYSQSCYQQPGMMNHAGINRNAGINNDMPIGMCYVPWQMWGNTYEPGKALERGTMFPDLDKPFLGGAC